MRRGVKIKPWTTTQERYLWDNYGRLSAKSCAAELGRTTRAIYRKVYDLRITRNHNLISG